MTAVVIFVNVLVIAFLAWRGWKAYASTDSAVYWTGWGVRLAAGVSVGLVYRFYYTNGSDTFTFFEDASKLAQLFFDHPLQWVDVLLTGISPVSLETVEPRSVFFVAIVSIVNVVTGNNYWIASAWFSFYAFYCAYQLVRVLDQVAPQTKWASRLSLLFVPSVVFWSSGIVKETLALGSIAILATHFISLLHGKRPKVWQLLFIALHLFLLVSLKYYWAAILLPSMVASIVVFFFRDRLMNFGSTVGWWLVVYLTITIVATFTHPNFYLDRLVGVVVENHDQYMRISNHDNVIHFTPLDGSWTNLVANAPLAWWSGWFRPSLFEAHSITGWLAAFENLALLVLLVWKMRRMRMPSREFQLMVIAAITYAIVLSVFLALSTPNLGTLSRYRVGFLPFLVLLILIDHPFLRWSIWKAKSVG